MVKITWTDLALGDLKSIHNYIALDSQNYATKFINKLVTRVKQLEKFPNSGRIVPEIGNEFVRELIVGRYRIVYKVNSEEVSILRVQNFAKLLSDI